MDPSTGPAQLYAPRPQAIVESSPLYPQVHQDPLHPNGYKQEAHIGVSYRGVARTPSPTPSESEALSEKSRSFAINFKKYFNKEYLSNPRNVFTLVVTLVLIGLLITFVVMQNKIVEAMSPASTWLRETPGAWLIPIGIMIILSFPPLIGHELVAILCGDVWGVWIGFGIVAAGTFVGEIITYYTFRYCCKGRAEKMEEKNLRYALLSAVIREGGLKMAIIVRYSAIPAHLTTAIFATAGMPFMTFFIAAFVALPKQFAGVYLGVAEHSGAPKDENGDKKVTKTTTIIKIVVLTVTILMTIIAMRYVDNKIDNVKNRVIYARRKARQAKLAGSSPPAVSSFSSSSHTLYTSDVDMEEDVSTPLVGPRGVTTDSSIPMSMAPPPLQRR
ncbi:hypothetical protein C8Q74DRAFT_1257601, partial [Fomes fomentarius]